MSAKETFTPYALRDNQNTQHDIIDFKITSPLFYAQVARYAAIHDYFKLSPSKVDPEAATFHTSHPDLLDKLFKTPPNASIKPASADKDTLHPDRSSPTPTPQLNLLRWIPIHLLRRIPSPSHPSAFSDLDTCAMHLPTTNGRAYRKAILKLLLSDYLAFGMPAVIDAALWIVRIWLCWLCVRSFDGVVGLCDGDRQSTLFEVGKVGVGCLGVHFWRGLGLML